MNLDSLNKWLTLAANLGVIAGIFFLGVEIRQNTAATQAGSRDTVIASDLTLVEMQLAKPSLMMNQLKQDMSDIERAELSVFLVGVVRSREHQWLQYKNGLLDRETLDSFLTGLTITMSRPRPREWWDRNAYDYFNNDFVDEVNEILADMPITVN